MSNSVGVPSTRSDPSKDLIGALHLTPEVAHWLGYYTAQIAAFEYTLIQYLVKLASLKELSDGHAIFGAIMSISSRIDILESLSGRPENSSLQPHLKKLLSEARSINSQRNQYIHGLYKVNEITREVTLVTWPFSSGRSSKELAVTVGTLMGEIDRLHKFTSETAQFLNIEIIS